VCRNQKVARDLLELDCFHPVRIVIVIVTRIEGVRVSSGKPQAGRSFRKRISKKLTMRARDRSRSLSGYRLRSCAILGRSSRLGCDPVSTLFPPPREVPVSSKREKSPLLSSPGKEAHLFQVEVEPDAGLGSRDFFAEALFEFFNVAEEAFVLGFEVHKVGAFREFEVLLQGCEIDLHAGGGGVVGASGSVRAGVH
jgi:hypothetical protein